MIQAGTDRPLTSVGRESEREDEAMSRIEQSETMSNYDCYCSACNEDFTCFPRPEYCPMCGANLEEKPARKEKR